MPDAALARRLVDAQFPQWSGLPIRLVELDGWDNRTFRLGDELSVRLPSGPWYAEQVAKEQEWLPRLAPGLPLPIPQPVAAGVPGAGNPYPWSVYRWLPGRPLALSEEDHRADVALARDLGGFLAALRACPAREGPEPGRHNFFRGAQPDVYGEETLAAIAVLPEDAPITRDAARRIWDAATASRWSGAPVWFHGDVAEGNLLLRDEPAPDALADASPDAGAVTGADASARDGWAGNAALAAVIDFGTSGVGDPACDLVPAWTMFEEPARTAFLSTVGLDADTALRARGWALWKALITVRDRPRDVPARRTLARLAEAG